MCITKGFFVKNINSVSEYGFLLFKEFFCFVKALALRFNLTARKFKQYIAKVQLHIQYIRHQMCLLNKKKFAKHTKFEKLPEFVCIHGEPPDVLLRMDQDDVQLGRVQAEQRHVRAQADRYAQRRHLDLNI
jgi:hypothetical protein